VLVEAKNENIVGGIPQCLAEMVATLGIIVIGLFLIPLISTELISILIEKIGERLRGGRRMQRADEVVPGAAPPIRPE